MAQSEQLKKSFGVSATDAEMKAMDSEMKSTKTPAQVKAYANKEKSLMAARTQALSKSRMVPVMGKNNRVVFMSSSEAVKGRRKPAGKKKASRKKVSRK